MNTSLPPLKAKETGRSGFKHTLAYFPVFEGGQIGIRLKCHKVNCECGGFYPLEDLIAILKSLEGEKGKEAA